MSERRVVFGSNDAPLAPLTVSNDAPHLNHFDFADNAHRVPVYLPGEEFYTRKLRRRRKEIKTDANVRSAVRKLWACFNIDVAEGQEEAITRKQYATAVNNFAAALVPDMDRDAVKTQVKADWKHDTMGDATMSYGQFYDMMFDFAEQWVVDCTPEAYALFFVRLIRRTTIKQIVKGGKAQQEEEEEEEDEEEEEEESESEEEDAKRKRRPKKAAPVKEKKRKPSLETVAKTPTTYKEREEEEARAAARAAALAQAEKERAAKKAARGRKKKFVASDSDDSDAEEAEAEEEEPEDEEDEEESDEEDDDDDPPHLVIDDIDETLWLSDDEDDLDLITYKWAPIDECVCDELPAPTVDESDPSAAEDGRGSVASGSDSRPSSMKGTRKELNLPEPTGPKVPLGLCNRSITDTMLIMKARGYTGSHIFRLWHVDKAEHEARTQRNKLALHLHAPSMDKKTLVKAFADRFAQSYGDVNDTSPPSYWIIGRPGSGKSTLASALAAELGAVHIDVTKLAEREISRNTLLGKALNKIMLSGSQIPYDAILHLFRITLQSEDVAFRGFVLDGFPSSQSELELLHTWGVYPKYIIDLDISAPELQYRREGTRYDPESGRAFTDRQLNPPPPLPKPAKVHTGDSDSEEEEEEEEEEDDDPETRPFKPERDVNQETTLIRPQDIKENLVKSIAEYDVNRQVVSDVIDACPGKYKLVLDARVPPADLLRIVRDNWPTIYPVCEPLALDGEGADVDGLLDEDTELTGPRTLSRFGEYCPVDLVLHNKVTKGDPEFNVAYKGKLYLMSSLACREAFLANPEHFVRTVPSLPAGSLRLMLIGAPLTGKSTQARLIAEAYGLAYLDVDELIEEAVMNIPERSELRDEIRSGTTLPATFYADTIVNAIDNLLSESTEDISAMGGYILDGYIPSAEHGQALVAKNIFPDRIIILEDETGGEVLQARAKNIRLDLDTGNFVHLAYDSELCQPDLFGDALPVLAKELTAEERSRLREIPVAPLVDGFNSQLSEFLDSFAADDDEDAEPVPSDTISCAGHISDVFGRLCQVVDPFFEKAERADYSSVPEDERELGMTRNFCPVTLSTHNILLPGSEDTSALFRDQYYLFAGEEELERFLANPADILHEVSIPPPRLMITGPPGSGKSSQAQLYSERFNIPVVCIQSALHMAAYQDPESDLARRVAPYFNPESEEEFEDQTMVDVLVPLLQQEPYASQGWIVEGLPLTSGQIELLLAAKIYPDCAVQIEITEELSLKRLEKPVDPPPPTPPPSEPDVDEGAGEEEEEEEEEDPAELERLEKERAERHAERLAEKQEEHRQAIIDAFETNTANAESMLSDLEEAGIAVVTVNGVQKPSVMLRHGLNALVRFLEEREGLFATALPVETEIAMARLQHGFRSYSPMGPHDPVRFFEKGELTDIFNTTAYPVVLGRHIYFCRNEAARQKFIQNPVKYTSGAAVAPPTVRSRSFIIGPPKSGKSTLAGHLVRHLGVERVTARVALEAAIRGPTALGWEIQHQFLLKGFSVPDELVVQALALYLASYDCIRRGYTLDGFPLNMPQIETCEKLGIIPSHVFIMDGSPELFVARANIERRKPHIDIYTLQLHLIHDSSQVHNLRHKAYTVAAKDIAEHYWKEFDNLHVLDASRSKWSLSNQAISAIRRNIKRRQSYVHNTNNNLAASVYDVCKRPTEVRDAIGRFGNYCPVSLAAPNNKQLRRCGETLEFTAVYGNKYYHMAGKEELAAFLARADHYIQAAELPVNVPTRVLNPTVPLERLELKGYCPVTLGSPHLDGFDCVVHGRADTFVVQYDGKYYTFTSEANLETFMRKPWLYDKLTLPHKLPPPPEPLDVLPLPIHGYCEQTTADAITESLTAVSKLRPKFPYKGIKESALKYLALLLKANNPRLATTPHVQARHQKKLKEFEDYCNIMPYIQKHSPLINTHLLHTETSLRLYERKAEQFDKIAAIDMWQFITG